MDRAWFDRASRMFAAGATRRRALAAVAGALAVGVAGRSRRVGAQEATPAECPTTSAEENAAVVRRWFDEAYGPNDLATLDELQTPNVVHHSPSFPEERDPAAILGAVRAGFLDMRAAVDHVVAGDDLVAARFTLTGTHGGPLLGLAPTDAAVTIAGINVFRFECGKIAEVWNETDVAGMLRQIGVLPAQANLAPTAGASPAASPPASPAACPTTTPEENAALVERYWSEVWSGGDAAAALAEMFTPGEVHHWGIADATVGPEPFAQRLAAFRAAFPDFAIRADQIVAEDDAVVSRWTATGTHQGEWLGIPPTGTRVEYTGVNEFRFECGRIAESWSVADHAGLLRQIGGLPEAAGQLGTPTTPAP